MRIVVTSAMLLAMLFAFASNAVAFDFLVKERGPAASKLKTEIAVAITSESLGAIVKSVIVEADNPDQNVSVAIYLSARIPRVSVRALGKAVREATSRYSQSQVSFYMLDQRNALWATAHSAPKTVVKVIGLSREQYLVAAEGVPKNKLNANDRLVAESIMTGENGGAAQIIRNRSKYYFRKYDRDTEESTDTEVVRERGRYWIKCCAGKRYLVTKGAIEVYDDNGFVETGRRLK